MHRAGCHDLNEEQLDHLVRYARMTPVNFVPLRDAAEKLAGFGSSEEEIQRVTLKLIDDTLDQGVRIGDTSPRDVAIQPGPRGESRRSWFDRLIIDGRT